MGKRKTCNNRTCKKERYNHLNDIYIEEKMYDDLYQNICKYGMSNVIHYEKYLLPKYHKQLLQI